MAHVPMQYIDPFSKVVEAERTGLTVEVKVKALNKGGLVVLFGELKGGSQCIVDQRR